MGPPALRIGSGQLFLACDKAFKHNSTRNCAPTELEKQFGRPPIVISQSVCCGFGGGTNLGALSDHPVLAVRA